MWSDSTSDSRSATDRLQWPALGVCDGLYGRADAPQTHPASPVCRSGENDRPSVTDVSVTLIQFESQYTLRYQLRPPLVLGGKLPLLLRARSAFGRLEIPRIPTEKTSSEQEDSSSRVRGSHVSDRFRSPCFSDNYNDKGSSSARQQKSMDHTPSSRPAWGPLYPHQ